MLLNVKLVFVLALMLAVVLCSSSDENSPKSTAPVTFPGVSEPDAEEPRKGSTRRSRQSATFTPCSVKSYACIRNYLAANSRCNPRVFGSIPSQITLVNRVYEMPFFNATFNDQTTRISNLNKCTISVFYRDRASNATVVTVDCQGLEIYSNRTVLIHSPGNPDRVFSYTIGGIYGLVRLTITLPVQTDLNICRQKAYGYVSEIPEFKFKANNRATQQYFNSGGDYFADYPDVYSRELFIDRADNFFRYFVNSMICDYGCRAFYTNNCNNNCY